MSEMSAGSIQVYKCGGCGTILQAKNRANDLRSRSVGLNGTVTTQMNGSSHSSEDKASSSSRTSCNGATIPDSRSFFSDQIDEKNRSKSSGDCSFDRNEAEKDERNFSVGSESSSLRLEANFLGLDRRHEREGSHSSDGIESRSSIPKAEKDKSEFSEGIAVGSSPKAKTSELGECSLERHIVRANSKSTEGIESYISSPKDTLGECLSDHNNAKNQDKIYEDYDKISVEDNGCEQLAVSRGIPSPMEVASSESKVSLPITAASFESLEDAKSLTSAPNLEVDIAVEIDSDSASSSKLNAVAKRDSISSDIIVSSPDEQSNEVVDFNTDVDSNVVDPGATRKSVVTVEMPAQESSSSGTLTSFPNEHHIDVAKSFDHMESSNTYETTGFCSPRSEFSAAVRDRSKSPETRSHHAYNGSVSSYEGIDDQFYNHNANTF